ANCLEHRDAARLAALKVLYLHAASTAMGWAYGTSQALYGRQVRHVVALHVGAFTAAMTDAYLTDLEKQGATFISLDEALSDPVYASASQPNPLARGHTRIPALPSLKGLC